MRRYVLLLQNTNIIMDMAAKQEIIWYQITERMKIRHFQEILLSQSLTGTYSSKPNFLRSTR